MNSAPTGAEAACAENLAPLTRALRIDSAFVAC